MKIDRVTVRYGELRSTGYPNFSNRKHELELSATLEPGDTPENVRIRLLETAKEAVVVQFNEREIDRLPSWLSMPKVHDMNVPF